MSVVKKGHPYDTAYLLVLCIATSRPTFLFVLTCFVSIFFMGPSSYFKSRYDCKKISRRSWSTGKNNVLITVYAHHQMRRKWVVPDWIQCQCIAVKFCFPFPWTNHRSTQSLIRAFVCTLWMNNFPLTFFFMNRKCFQFVEGLPEYSFWQTALLPIL